MKIFAIILAGGKGTRLWPLSREKKPKQLLNLSGKTQMVNETIYRLDGVIDKNNIYIVTNTEQQNKIKGITENCILKSNILVESESRNTAACIGYAAVKILMERGDGILVVLPSDAYINNVNNFKNILKQAIDLTNNSERLITIGIPPTCAATGYGYIKYIESNEIEKKVEKFHEKPDLTTAEAYINDGSFVWNSGMFIWKISTILLNYKKYLPDMYKKLISIKNAIGKENEKQITQNIYSRIEKISIDYGILEKADNVSVIIGDFGWSDVGDLNNLSVFQNADRNGNVNIGDCIIERHTKNCIVYSTNRLVATLGVSNLIIIETPDAILVCDKDRTQEIKEITEQINREGFNKFL